MKWLIITFILISFSVVSQNPIKATFKSKIKLEVDNIAAIDNFGDIYYVHDNVLILQSNKRNLGNLTYNNLQLGQITSVNAFNPLKINLFYKDFNSAIILDNRLAEIKKIDFNTIQPFRNITKISVANDNSIWIYNQDTQQIELFDYKYNKTKITSLPLEGTLLDIKSNYNFCWVLTDKFIYTYNYFGSLVSKIDHEGFKQIEIDNDILFVLKENKIFYSDKNNNVFEELELPKLLINRFLVTNETLYIYHDEFLHQYQLKTD